MTLNNDHRYDFKVDLEAAQVQERELYEAFHNSTIEVKHDRQAIQTGNIYIEFECDKGATGIFRPSGIATTESDWYAFKIGDAWLIAPTDHVRYIARTHWDNKRLQPHGSCPTRGVVVPLSAFLKSVNEAPFTGGTA